MKKKPFPKESVIEIVARRRKRQKMLKRDVEDKIDGYKKTDS